MVQTAAKRLVTEATLPELVQDILGSSGFLKAGSNISLTYDDPNNTLTIAASSGGTGTTDPQVVRDTIANALRTTGVLSFSYNSAAGTITLTSSATANSTDAQLRDRSTHTGTQSVSTITGLSGVATSGAYSDLSGVPASDPSAGTAGLRTLGTGAQQAASGTDARIVGAAQRALTKRTITASYTVVAADTQDYVLHSTATSAINITLPAGLTTEISIPWRQFGAGQLTFVAGSGVTLVSRGSVFKSAGQYAGGVVTAIDSSTWLLEGDISS